MTDIDPFAAARAAFAGLAPEAPSPGFEARLSGRLGPPARKAWSLADLLALTPAFAAAGLVGFALLRLENRPPSADGPRAGASQPGYDAGRRLMGPDASPCSTALDCG